MSLSGRRMMRPVTGPKKPRVVSKIRRTREEAYTSNWAIIAAEVKRRAGYRCQKCGTSDGPFEADHRLPVAKGGKTTWSNLWCLCHRCHDKRPGHMHLFKKRTLKRKQ